jgi:hypothetical protein
MYIFCLKENKWILKNVRVVRIYFVGSIILVLQRVKIEKRKSASNKGDLFRSR